MKFFLHALALTAGVLQAVAAMAIDPGVARGAMRISGDTVQLAHAYAHLQDRGPGAKELRVAIVDRQVPQKSLAGDAIAIAHLARERRVLRLLLRLDPRDTSKLVVTVLDRPAKSGAPLSTGSNGTLKKLAIANNRVSGELEMRMPAAALSRIRFSAPLFRGP